MKKGVVCLLLLVLLLAAVFPGRVGMASEQRMSQDIISVEKETEQPFSNLNGITGRYSSLSQLEQLRIGIPSGTNFDLMMHERFPEADFFYYNSQADLLAALDSGKIDAFPSDEPVIRYIMGQRSDITYIPEYVDNYEAAYCFPKTSEGKALCERFSAFIRSLKASGQLSAIEEKWFQQDESIKPILDYGALPAVNGTLTLATDGDYMPFEYVRDGMVVGYDIEIAALFCEANGYALRIEIMNMDAVVPSVKTGKCDVGGSALSITPERAESVLFSEPNYAGGTVMVVLKSDDAQAIRSARWQDYNGKRLGVLTGPLMEGVAAQYFPDSETMIFNSYPDCITALLAGRIDAYLGDELGVKAVHAEQPQVDYIHERITENNYSFAFRKNDYESAELCTELNAFLAKSWADGTMRELDDIWFGVDEARKVVDMSSLTGENGTIKVVTTSTDAPFSYIKDGKNVGYDIDLVVRFCRDRGYALELGDVDFAGRIPAIESGKFDFTTDMNVTPEREEQVLFSDPVCKGGIVLAVRSADVPEQNAAELTPSAEQTSDGKLPITSLEQLSQPGIVIAVGLDTPAEASLKQDYPEAKLIPYTDLFSAYLDVANGRVDAFFGARREMQFALEHGMTGVRLLEENYAENKIAVGISPVTAIPDLKGCLNAFIAEAKADGTLDDMYDRWVTRDEETMPEIPGAENPSFTLRVGTTGTVMPYSYYVGTELAGYDIELARRFARWLGAGLEFKVYDFGGIIPAAEAGSIDCIMSNLFYTEEKDESIPFSDVLFEVEITAMVRDDRKADSNAAKASVTTLSQLNGKRIGVQTGTSFDKAVFELLPDAQVSYFNSKADLINALLTYKIDAYAVDEPVIKAQMQEDDRLTYVPEYMESFDFAYVFPKTDAGQALCDQFSEYLRKIREDGTMARIEAKWFGEDESPKTIADYKSFPAPNGTLNMATEALYEPFSYILNNEISGYDIDIVVCFCEAYGYGLKITDMSFDAVLPSVQSGKCDFGGAGITITEERRESVLFSEPNFSGGTVLAVLKAEQPAVAAPTNDVQEDNSFWGGIKSSFNKTFLRESRWKLFLEGVLTTLLITVLSILLGTALGFLVFMACRNGNLIANGATRFSMWLVQGMPMVVLLMILYYIIFGSVAISGLWVAVIGFTLTFGAAVFGLLKMGVGAVDKGQYEAAYALGYSSRRTFFKIILPQALPHVMSAYKGEIVGLIKATAIVGYIAVQDLTKMGDIVRSRTYEAFFPLIAVTIIYFVLEGLIGFLISRISVNFDPKRRKPAEILKGVKTDD